MMCVTLHGCVCVCVCVTSDSDCKIRLTSRTFLHAVCGACRNDESSYAAVEMVLRRYPQCVDLVDQHGQSPLHISAIAGRTR